MSDPSVYRDAAEAALAAASRLGADAAEASIGFGDSLSIEVRNGALESVERDESRSLALRAFVGKRQAAAVITDLRPEAVQALAERVVAMARMAPEDAYCGLLEADYLAKDPPKLELADAAAPDAQTLERLAAAAEAAALATPGVSASAGADASASRAGRFFMTSGGFRAETEATRYSLSAQPIAEREGAKERDYEYDSKRFFSDLASPEAIGAEAGARAAARLGARKVKSSTAPVIFEPRLAGSLIGPFLGAVNGAAIARGVSFLKDRLGHQVFPSGFSLLEDPFLPRGLASRAFDGEGGAVGPFALVRDGVVQSWLLNSAAARQLGLAPNGHASGGHGGPPGIGTANVTVTPGDGDLESLMRDAKSGLVVTEMFSPALNANTGDWSVGVAGYWFEAGARAYPVSEVTVAGNLIEMYARLIAAGDSQTRGGMTTPSLMVDALSVGGA